MGLLRVLPTKPERSSPEPIQVQEKELESTEVELLSEEGLADNSDGINNPDHFKPISFSEMDEWVASAQENNPKREGVDECIDDQAQSSCGSQQLTANTGPKRLDLSIDDLGCSVRVTNALHRSGISKLSDLHGMSSNHLLGIKNFGQKSLNELSDALYALGYSDESGMWVFLFNDELNGSIGEKPPSKEEASVTRFAGQSDVEQQLRIDCQDQSVLGGPAGAAYWNQEKVSQLLQSVKEFFQFSSVEELTRDDIRHYFEWSKDEDIKNRKIDSFFAALSRLQIVLPEASDDGLVTLGIDSKSSSFGKAESIPQPIDDQPCEPSTAPEGFSFDAEAAARMRIQDQDLKRELDQIFADVNEPDLLADSQPEAVPKTPLSPGLDLVAIENMIRKNIAEDLILISVLQGYATKEDMMYASFVDKLNEISIAKCGENLLEDEDDANLYVNPVALDNLL